MQDRTSRATRVTMTAMAAVVLASSGVLNTAADGQAAAGAWRVRHYELADLTPDELPWTSEPPLRFPARKPRD